MNWNPLQREALEAMGFALLVPRTAASAAEGATSAPVPQSPAPERGVGARPVGRDAPLSPNREGAPAAARLQDRLARALLRAAGVAYGAGEADLGGADLGEADLGGLGLGGLDLESLDLDNLRRDPAAKRALWPRLRALRRTGG